MTLSTTTTATPADVAEVTAPVVPASRPLANAGRKAVADLRKAREDKRDAEDRIKDAEARVRQFLAGSRSGTIAGQTVVRVVAGSNSHFDRQTLATAYPEAYEAALRVTEYDSLRLA